MAKVIVLSSLLSVKPTNSKPTTSNNLNGIKKYKVIHKSGHSYLIYHFQNLGIYVKQSVFEHDSEHHPPFDAFKPIPQTLFNTIKNSSVFKVIPC